jgi:hypothetical protein
MDFYGLPDQTLIEISKVSPLAWFRICEMVPFVGEWTPCPSTQRLVKRPFVVCIRGNASPYKKNPCIWWTLNGLEHRDGDLPTFEYADGSKFWYKLGKLHRDNDLPAIKWLDDISYWYRNGLQYNPQLT